MKKIIINFIFILNLLNCFSAEISNLNNNSTFIARKLLANAVQNNNLEEVKKLIESKADVNTESIFYRIVNDYTGKHHPLIEAIIQRNPEMVKLLLSAKANVEQSASVVIPTNRYSIWPLDFILSDKPIFDNPDTNNNKNNDEIIKLLLEFGAKASDRYSIFMKVSKDVYSMFKDEYDINDKVILKEKLSESLHVRIILNDIRKFKLLLDCVLVGPFFKKSSIETTLKDRVQRIRDKKKVVLPIIINGIDRFGFTPLMWIASRKNNEFLDELILFCSKYEYLKIPELFIDNSNGESAISLAQKHCNDYALIKLLNLAAEFMSSINENIPLPLYKLIAAYC